MQYGDPNAAAAVQELLGAVLGKCLDKIRKGTDPESGESLRVIVGAFEGAPIPDLDSLPEEFAPGITKDMYVELKKRLRASIRDVKSLTVLRTRLKTPVTS